MEEIIQQVVQRVGIPEDKARMAVEAVLGQLEQRLPDPIASQLRAHLSGDGAGAGEGGLGLDDVAKGLGGMFGK